MNTLLHDDAQERAEIKKLIAELRTRGAFNYAYFNDIYKICVERKRRKILEAIKEMDTSHADCLSDPRPAEEARMRRMMLYTYYVYLGDDDAYRQKAYAEFLKNRIERLTKMNKDCDECWGLQAHLEGLYEHSDYQGYQALTESKERLWVYQENYWRIFFRNSEKYLDIIPRERPSVLYTDSSINIPRFIFEPPYVDEYSEREFHARFMQEWDLTHYNPLVYENFCEHFIDFAPYRDELGDKPEKAYRDYQNAVNLFRKMSGTESQDDKNIKMEGQKWK